MGSKTACVRAAQEEWAHNICGAKYEAAGHLCNTAMTGEKKKKDCCTQLWTYSSLRAWAKTSSSLLLWNTDWTGAACWVTHTFMKAAQMKQFFGWLAGGFKVSPFHRRPRESQSGSDDESCDESVAGHDLMCFHHQWAEHRRGDVNTAQEPRGQFAKTMMIQPWASIWRHCCRNWFDTVARRKSPVYCHADWVQVTADVLLPLLSEWF